MDFLDLKYLRRVPDGIQSSEVLTSRFLRCWEVLHGCGRVLPPNIVADLLFAGQQHGELLSQPGEMYSQLPFHIEWDSWVKDQWIPWNDQADPCPESLKSFSLRYGATVSYSSNSTRELSTWYESMSTGFQRLWEIEEWAGQGLLLLKAVRSGSQLHEMIGVSSLLHARNSVGQFDRLFSSRFTHFGASSQEAQLLGRHGDGHVDEVVRRPYGIFREQSVGSLPRNLGNLSPVEVGCMAHKRARDLFRMNIANSNLDQRSFESSMRSERRAFVRVDVELHDEEVFHKWNDVIGQPPSISHYRACQIAVLADLVRSFDPDRIELDIHAGYQEVKGQSTNSETHSCALDVPTVQSYLMGDDEESMKQLALYIGAPDMNPDIFRDSPCIGAFHAEDTGRSSRVDDLFKSDRNVRVILTTVGAVESVRNSHSSDSVLLDSSRVNLFVCMIPGGDGEEPHWVIIHSSGQTFPSGREQMISQLTEMVYNQAASESATTNVDLDFRA